MFNRVAVEPVKPAGGTKLIDLCVIAAAGRFFVNIVLGTSGEDDQMLFLAAEIGAPMLELDAPVMAEAHPG